MQQLVVENGKLVVYTDNAKYVDGDIYTNISGDFVVDAKLVMSLLSEKLNLPLYAEIWKKGATENCRYISSLENVCLLNNDEATYSLIKKHVDARKIAEARYERAMEAITKFNNTRRFYERKINTLNL